MFDSDDPLSIVLEGIVRLGWALVRAIGAILLAAARNPVPAIIVVGLAIEGYVLGSRFLIWTTIGVLLALITWRLAAPSSFANTAHPRLASIAAAPWYRSRWAKVASRNGLVAYDHQFNGHGAEQSRLPRIRRVRVTRAGVHTLQLSLPAGLTPSHVAAQCDGLAHALKCREARVVEDCPGRVFLELHRRDVLAPVIRPSAPTGQVDLAAVQVGRHEDGEAWCLRLLGTHVLVAGATGAGKGSVLWSLLNGAASAIAAGSLQVWAIDPKGGMELRPGLPLFARFEDGSAEQMCLALEQLVTLKDVRARELAQNGVRTHAANPKSPHILLVVDELATLTAFAERTVVRRIEQALGLLLTQGRACGITVLAAVQDPGKDVVVWRDLFPTRIAMRLDNPIQVDMVLGDGARDLGAAADHISELTPGVAYVRVEGTRALRRVRASYLTDADIAELAASSPRPTPIRLTAVADTERGEVA